MTILGVLVSTVASFMIFNDVMAGNTFDGTVYTWAVVAGLKMEVGFLIDSLTVTMMVVVTFVSLMVHVYTIGYMADDPGYQRFFAYISLFTFSMMMLVMANNFLQLFFGWEAVGLVSYLLIGFWYTRPTAIFANLKAFLVNRVGDFGFVRLNRKFEYALAQSVFTHLPLNGIIRCLANMDKALAPGGRMHQRVRQPRLVRPRVRGTDFRHGHPLPFPEAHFTEVRLWEHGQARGRSDHLRRLRRAAERTGKDGHRARQIHAHAAGQQLGLPPASRRQRRILVALDPPLAVPHGFAMANQQES